MRAPPSFLAAAACGLTLGVFLASCSKSTKPEVTGPTLSGRIRLVAERKDEVGTSLGVLRVETVDRARVHLRKPDGTIDSTLTEDGRYEFPVSQSGSYRAFVRVHPGHAESTAVVAFSGSAVAADPLVLTPFGAVNNYPNPHAPDGGGIEFSVDSVRHVDITVKDFRGRVYFSDSYDAPTKFQHRHWDGRDAARNAAPPGVYWCIVAFGNVIWYGLVVRE